MKNGIVYNRFLKGVTRLSQLYDFSMHAFSHVVGDLKTQLANGTISIQSNINSSHGFMSSHQVASTLSYVNGPFPKQLRSVVLIRLVSLFEVFLIDQTLESARLAGVFFKLDAKLDWPRERVLAFSSLGEIHDHFRKTDARQLSSGGFDQIRKFYQSQLKFDVCPPDVKLDDLREIHSRRHLYVHNDGLIDEEYSRAFAKNAQIGSTIEVTDQYLKDAALLLKRVAHYVAITARTKFPEIGPITIAGSSEPLGGKVLYSIIGKFHDALTQQQYFDIERKLPGGAIRFASVFVGGSVKSGLATWVLSGNSAESKAFFMDLGDFEKSQRVSVIEKVRLTPKTKANQ